MNNFPSFDLSGNVALVTGAARGLGRAIALALAKAGADVALGLRDVKTGADLVQEIEQLGRRAVRLQMDVANREQISAAVAQAVEQFGKLDILVNNAGIAPENLAENVREEDFDATLAVNLSGTFFTSQAAGRVMIRQGHGRIINMSSQAGFVALPTESIYCMTKAAIVHLTKCLAVEWGKHNITVNAVAPTFIHTPGTEEYLADPQHRADVIERIAALHRIGEPMDVAGSVVFLASRVAAVITEHNLLIDGGWAGRCSALSKHGRIGARIQGYMHCRGVAMAKRRVVITGMGTVSPNGVGNSQFSEAILAGTSGVQRISRFDPSDIPVQIAGEVRNFDELAWV